MKPVTRVEGRAYPLGRANVDTDLIIPAQHLKTTGRAGLAAHAFAPLRAERDNIFEDPRYAGAPILIAGHNFGCGSSREHAVWAIRDFGIEVVIASSFSDIFASNAFKNGLVAIALPQDAIERLLEVALELPLAADLETMTVTSPLQDRFEFTFDPFRRACLLAGLDEIALTLENEAAITAFEARSNQWIPLVPNP